MTDAEHEKFHGLLKQFNNAILITHAPGGNLRARPMAIAHLDDACQLWFLSPRESAKIHEIEDNTKVHIVCQNENSSYVSMSGRASLVDDRAQVKTIWKEPFRVWFPNGPEDPNCVLIAVKPEEGEYWDNSGMNKVKYLYEAAKAYLSGETPHIDKEIHGVVKL